jgi:cobyrinic acid a,c-diamide synthase
MSQSPAQVRAFVVAGTHSGVGKTMVSTALMAAYRRRGLRVLGFKVGPDFIDPSYHQAVSGRASRNLDGWMLGKNTAFHRAAAEADLSIIEGVMGLFDGAGASSECGSTAEIAKWLGAPVILVLDAEAMARSAASIVLGFERFDPKVRVAAVVANKTAGVGHYRYVDQAIRAYCKAEPAGWLARTPELDLPSRHLGLVLDNEILNEERVERLADWIERGLDLDRLFEISAMAGIWMMCRPPLRLEPRVRGIRSE